MNAYHEENINSLSISYLHLRKVIGWLGMLLPYVLWFGNSLINKLDVLNNPNLVEIQHSKTYTPGPNLKSSISHFYYTTTGELFTGTLIAVALFLFCYKGYKKQPGERGFSDNTLTNIAALSALGVVIFPTAGDGLIVDNLRIFQSSTLCQTIHFIMATLFFSSKAILIIWNFRRTGDPTTFGTKKSHRFFLFCGIGMITAIVLLFIYAMFLSDHFPTLKNYHIIYWLESIALFFFGMAWLLKGKVDFLYLPKKMKMIAPSASLTE